MKLILRWQPLALWGLALLGLILRLYGLNWDQGNSFHPDERQILFHVIVLAWPTSVAQFFDPVNSPLNPHFFAYGSFPLYLLALLGHIFIHATSPATAFVSYTLLGRIVSALFDSGTILVTGYLGLLLTRDEIAGRRYAWQVALLAAALVAFTPLQVQLSHFYAVDTILLFFVVLTLLACVALVDTKKLVLWLCVACLGYGLALATKISAAPLAVSLGAAVLLRCYRRRDLFAAVNLLCFAFILTLIVFLIAQPYTLLDMPNFVQQVVLQSNLVRGTFDLPYVRQFAGTTPYIYEAQNMLLWGMGVTLGLAAFAGLLWLLWRVWKREAALWLIVLSWVLIYSAITGSFYAKFMRYMLPIYPLFTLMAASVVLAFAHHECKIALPSLSRFNRALPVLRTSLIALLLAGTIFQGLALLNVYSQPNTRIQASRWIYSHLQPGSALTYEQWDDPLPVAVDGHDPAIYMQATYTASNGQATAGLDLYGDDTAEKARQLANLLPTVNAITMPTDRLDKSIPRLPFRYPLTIHYYQLLFSGQLGFHLAAQFENRPNLFGITLDDSGADESYSVFDHPTARIFVRDDPYPYTSDQLFQKLLDGVQLPAQGAHLSGVQRALLLSPQQIDDYQQSPPFGVQFPAHSFSNTVPIFFWWLVLTLLGLLTYPLLFLAFRALADRGYIFAKLLGMLLLAYLAWILAVVHVLAFNRFSLLFVFAVQALGGAIAFIVQRHAILTFLRQRWRTLLFAEVLFSLAYLSFIGIRLLNPDLWNVMRGGEKPMELAFLNAVLRSPYMPPLDPWFSGGYINYYYYGYVIFAALIKLTGIVPTVAFNLAIPTLFALTFVGVVVIIYSLALSLPVALLGGYFAALIGNFDGFAQLKGQLLALLAHVQPPAFNYWQSSRIIPFTINEFPFWTFLFADLHPHVVNMPIAVCMLGVLATLLLSLRNEGVDTSRERRREQCLLYLFAAFIFGTLACVNPWDMPVYALLLVVVLVIQRLQQKGQETKTTLLVALAFRLATALLLCMLGFLFYLPFYSTYQQLYVNGLGLVKQGTGQGDYLMTFGFWLFLVLSFFLAEFYQRFLTSLTVMRVYQHWRVIVYTLVIVLGLTVLLVSGVKVLLTALLVLGLFLFILLIRSDLAAPWLPQLRLWQSQTREHDKAISTPGMFAQLKHIDVAERFQDNTDVALLSSEGTANDVPISDAYSIGLHSDGSVALSNGYSQDKAANPIKQVPTEEMVSRVYCYLLLIMGICICLGMELVYVRDFLDDSVWMRMNTVFKFSMQAWLCFAIGGALAVQRLWSQLAGFVSRSWRMIYIVLMLCCSVFLFEGTPARIYDHQLWIDGQPPALGANYTPTIDGFAFVRAWYPGDASAIAWLNDHISGSPVILEAAAPVSYQWFSRVSVFTGLPDVLGWPDHVGEQRYASQPLNRVTDIGLIYSTTDTAVANELLHYYHVRYVYVGPLERELYASQSSVGLDKFERMAADHALSVIYQADGVTIYQVM